MVATRLGLPKSPDEGTSVGALLGTRGDRAPRLKIIPLPLQRMEQHDHHEDPAGEVERHSRREE